MEKSFEQQVQDILSILRNGQGVLADKGVTIEIDDKWFPSVNVEFFKNDCRMGWMATDEEEQLCTMAVDGIAEYAKVFEVEEVSGLMRGWIDEQAR